MARQRPAANPSRPPEQSAHRKRAGQDQRPATTATGEGSSATPKAARSRPTCHQYGNPLTQSQDGQSNSQTAHRYDRGVAGSRGSRRTVTSRRRQNRMPGRDRHAPLHGPHHHHHHHRERVRSNRSGSLRLAGLTQHTAQDIGDGARIDRSCLIPVVPLDPLLGRRRLTLSGARPDRPDVPSSRGEPGTAG